MAKKCFDEVLCCENLSYPIKVLKWELCKVKDFDKYYVKVYLAKENNFVSDITLNITTFDNDGNEIGQLKDLKISNICKKEREFTEIYSVSGCTSKIFVEVTDCSQVENKQSLKSALLNKPTALEKVTWSICCIALLAYTFGGAFLVALDVVSIILACAGLGMSISCIIKINLH